MFTSTVAADFLTYLLVQLLFPVLQNLNYRKITFQSSIGTVLTLGCFLDWQCVLARSIYVTKAYILRLRFFYTKLWKPGLQLIFYSIKVAIIILLLLVLEFTIFMDGMHDLSPNSYINSRYQK